MADFWPFDDDGHPPGTSIVADDAFEHHGGGAATGSFDDELVSAARIFYSLVFFRFFLVWRARMDGCEGRNRVRRGRARVFSLSRTDRGE